MIQESKNPNRREFLKTSSKATLGASLFASIIPSTVWSTSKPLPSDRITLGFIGVGKQGTGLLMGFLNNPKTQVVGVCDVDRKKLNRAKKIVEQHYAANQPSNTFKGCYATQDFREVISRPDTDAVVIATPDHWHSIPVILAGRAGKDIYCEKPLSLTIAEARAMVTEVRKYARIFQTGSMQRSDSKFRHACELVRNGDIGRIQSVRVSIRTGFPNHPMDCDLPAEEVPDELDWDMWLGPAPKRPYHSDIAPPIHFEGWPKWRNYHDYSGGGMTDWGAHHYDIAQWGLGMDNSGPIEIIPPKDSSDNLLTHRYKNGVVLTTDFENNYILFTGTEGTVKVNRNYISTKPDNLINHRIDPDKIHLYKSDNHLDDWLQSIRDRSDPICNVEIGCRSVTVCHLGNLAVQLKRPLKWDPEKELFTNDPEANRMLSRSMRSPWHV